MYKSVYVIFISILVLCAGGCSDNSTGVEDPPNEPDQTTGELEVNSTTTGSAVDTDGYTVTVGASTSKSLDSNGSTIFTDLQEGAYSVELSGLAQECNVDGDNPAAATVTSGATTRLHFEVVCETAAPQASGIIAFTKVVDQNFEIFTMHADGTNQQRLTNNSVQDNDAVISPDGSMIAFMSQSAQNTNYAVWVMDIDGSNKNQLTAYYSNNRYPSWSPDGSQIAFESDRDGNFNIYKMNVDGSNQTQLTSDTNQDQRPSWAPEGGKILFTSDRDGDGTSDIYTINVDGSGVNKLMDASGSNGINLFDPAWSPDATRIAYQGFSSNGAPRIFTANADGSNSQSISPDGYNSAYHPSWSPDGSYLAFTELASGSSGSAIWIVKTDGTDHYRLTDPEVTSSTHPGWGIANQ